ncbi:MAG: BPSL0067 family protein [Alphaproteobacteria bacterium]|nr:BPSL0067 family protein [Alphaproteobacteria bacterium]
MTDGVRYGQDTEAYPLASEPPVSDPSPASSESRSSASSQTPPPNIAAESPRDISRGWITDKKAEDIVTEAKNNGGYLNTQQDRDRGHSQECTALVKQLTGLDQAGTWKEGDKLKGLEDPPIKPGTALATFKNGVYESKGTGNHAAIFLQYEVQNGRRGMMVLDQWRGQPAHMRFIPFDDRRPPQNDAGAYSVIRK